MKRYNGLPIYIMELDGENTGVEIVSLVHSPAIERNFITLSKEVEVKFNVDAEKKIVVGPALVPDMPIYRRNSDGYEYYVTFSKEAIQQIAIKFFGDHNSTNVNLEHEVDVDGCVYFQSYFIDRERGICPPEFEDCVDGTWILAAKINNEAVWDLVKEGVLKGFSIEGNFAVKDAEEPVLNSIEDLLSYLKDRFSKNNI